MIKLHETRRRLIFSLILCLSLYGFVCSQAIELPPKENFHLFLLAGQSNMAGRGEVDPGNNQPHARVYMLNAEGEWVPAIDPVHFDKPQAGVGPGRSFANILAELDENVSIGLIPAACGGSSILTWVPGGYHDQTHSHPYDDAIERTHRAMQDGQLKAILWHQGESDSRPERAEPYKERLIQLIERFRDEFRQSELPIIIGQLGQFRWWSPARKQVDAAQKEVAEELKNVAFVVSDGLESIGDKTHFNTPSQVELGRRYAKAYLQLLKRGSE